MPYVSKEQLQSQDRAAGTKSTHKTILEKYVAFGRASASLILDWEKMMIGMQMMQRAIKNNPDKFIVVEMIRTLTVFRCGDESLKEDYHATENG
eukprot:985507_1